MGRNSLLFITPSYDPVFLHIFCLFAVDVYDRETTSFFYYDLGRRPAFAIIMAPSEVSEPIPNSSFIFICFAVKRTVCTRTTLCAPNPYYLRTFKTFGTARRSRLCTRSVRATIMRNATHRTDWNLYLYNVTFAIDIHPTFFGRVPDPGFGWDRLRCVPVFARRRSRKTDDTRVRRLVRRTELFNVCLYVPRDFSHNVDINQRVYTLHYKYRTLIIFVSHHKWSPTQICHLFG